MATDQLDDSVLQILSDLIAFKNRADAKGWREAFENMAVYLQRLGLTDTELDKIPVIHVAGTKGKGSTCAMIENILRRCGYRTGLYTSPHLVDVRERIRINGEMVIKSVFEDEFWKCYHRFAETTTDEVGMPGYFRFITLLGLRIFLRESVDVLVLEVGIGGRLDATNVIPHPVVCGITSLGFDHMDILGDTLPKIAREKAGILKHGRPGFTVQQPEDAMEALQEVAQRVGAPLHTVGPVDQWKPPDASTSLHVSLGGDHQRINAGLAVQLCATYERDRLQCGRATQGAQQRVDLFDRGIVPLEYCEGLATTSWPGRSQVVNDPELLPSTANGSSTHTAQPASISSSSDAATDKLAGVSGTSGSTSSVATVSHEINNASTTAAPVTSSAVTVGTNGSSTSIIAPPVTSRLSFFIDGAHTPESMTTCAEWFAAETAMQPRAQGVSTVERVLLFNCMKERSPAVLLPALSQALAAKGVTLSHTVFAPPLSQYGFLATKANPHPPGAAPHVPPTSLQLAVANSGLPGLKEKDKDNSPRASISSASMSSSSGDNLGSGSSGGGGGLGPSEDGQKRPVADYSWQQQLQGVWEGQCAPLHGLKAAMQQGDALVPFPTPPGLPTQDPVRGGIAPSLNSAIEWLRRLARARPQVQLQVLVTGSLYLVGDVLRLIGKAPK